MRWATGSSSYGFRLRPFFLDGIEIGTVWRQKLNTMTFLLDDLKDIGSFMERRTIQNDYWVMRSWWEQRGFHPFQEDIGIDVTVPNLHGNELKGQQCSNGINPAFCMPVFLAIATAAIVSIAVSSWCIQGKTTFVEVYYWTGFNLLMPLYSCLKPYALYRVSPWMKQSFFYS